MRAGFIYFCIKSVFLIRNTDDGMSMHCESSVFVCAGGKFLLWGESVLLGIGTDIIEIERVEKAIQKEAFLNRVFTEGERDYCARRGKGCAASYAVRWAGKEAVLKAFGTGLRGGTLLDIEIVPDALGAPKVHLSGYYAALSLKRGVRRVLLSLSHARDYAVAQCILEGEQHEDRFGK